MKLKTNKIGFKIISFQNNFKGDTTQQSIGTVISSEVKAINKEEIQFSKEISNKIYGIRNSIMPTIKAINSLIKQQHNYQHQLFHIVL